MSRNSRRADQRVFRREIRELIYKSGGPSVMWPKFPAISTEQAEEMFMAGRFETSNPLYAGSPDFAVAYAIDEWNRCFRLKPVREIEDNGEFSDRKWKVFTSAQDELFGNLVFFFFVDSTLAPYLGTLNNQDFFPFTPERLERLDRESRAIVFDTRSFDVPNLKETAVSKYGRQFSKQWTKADAVWVCSVWITGADLYCITDEGEVPPLISTYGAAGAQFLDRPKHAVSEHTRHLRSGQDVSVRSHIRRNRLIEAGVPWDEYNDHVVYFAYDVNEAIRYVGEGRPDRPQHVNSGISHSYKINEHFFLRGQMRIEVRHTGLTKPLALAIERLAIQMHGTGGALWNIKDNKHLRNDVP